MELRQIALVILLYSHALSFHYINSKICLHEDYGKHFTHCNSNNTRKIIIYKKSNCTEDQSSPQMNEVTVSCDTTCPEGEIIDYDFLTNNTFCSQCPPNTYSPGGNLKIRGTQKEWSEDVLKLFTINCFSISNFQTYRNLGCSPVEIMEDRSMILSGTVDSYFANYFFEMLSGFVFKKPGRITFKYQKDTTNSYFFFNGEFRLYIDYTLVLENYQLNSGWETFTYNLTAGYHEFLFFYTYFNSPFDGLDLKLRIESIEFDGLDDGAYECKKCLNSVSTAGSSICSHCDSNFYFDQATTSCIQCPDEKISFPNSVGIDSCIKALPCTEYDMEIVLVEECKEGKRKIIYDYVQPKMCATDNMTTFAQEEIEDCEAEKDISKSITCDSGKYPRPYFSLSSFSMVDKLFSNEVISGNSIQSAWKFNKNKIFSGTYLPPNIELILSTKFTILEKDGSVLLKMGLSLDENEYLSIKINNVTYVKYDNSDLSQKNGSFSYETQLIPLKQGDYTLTLNFERVGANQNIIKNAVYVDFVQVIGSNIPGEIQCSNCSSGSIRTEATEDKCTECPDGETSDTTYTSCVKCPSGITTVRDGNRICVECPVYTAARNGKCILFDVLHNEVHKLKFNFFPLKNLIGQICAEEGGVLCYNDKFIGPVGYSKNIQDEFKKDLFFISLFSPDAISITDFSYEDSTNEVKSGHIFGLFTQEKSEAFSSTDPYLMSNITYGEIKILKNMGKEIREVMLISSSVNVEKKLGVYINFINGDECMNDKSRRYESILYLKCSKIGGINQPILSHMLDNGCTFVFVWETPFACKSCLVSEQIEIEKGSCKGGVRQIVFKEDDDCNIVNSTRSELFGYNLTFLGNALSPNSEQLNRIYNSSERFLNDISGENKTETETVSEYPFEYIESNIYYQNCSFYENMDEKTLRYLILVPVVYLFTVGFIFFFYCKYRKIKNDYERLLGPEITNPHEPPMKDRQLQISER